MIKLNIRGHAWCSDVSSTLLYITKILRIWHAFCRASSRPFLLLFEQFKREKDAVSRTIEKVYRDERDSELWHDEKCANKLINLNKTSKWRNETFHMFYCIIPTSRHWNAAWLLVPTIDWFWWIEVFVSITSHTGTKECLQKCSRYVWNRAESFLRPDTASVKCKFS